MQACIRLDGCSVVPVIHSRKFFHSLKEFVVCSNTILGLPETLWCKPPNGQLAPKFPIFKMSEIEDPQIGSVGKNFKTRHVVCN